MFVKIFGTESDFLEIETQFKIAGIECQRIEAMHRTAESVGNDFLEIALASITAASAIICAYAKHRKKRVKITDGRRTVDIENYTPDQVGEILTRTKAFYIEGKTKKLPRLTVNLPACSFSFDRTQIKESPPCQTTSHPKPSICQLGQMIL